MYAAVQPIDDPEPEALTEMDGLRLLGLSRITRCAGCPRLEALREARDHRSAPTVRWPAPPRACRHQICAPLVRRMLAGHPSSVENPGSG